MIIRKSVLIDGKSISYLEANPGKNKTLLFLHGISLNASLFSGIIEDPQMSEFHSIAFDLPGHGENIHSEDPEDDYSLGALELLVPKLVAALGLDNFIIVGHSMGGHLSIHVLPELKSEVRGLIVMGAPPLSSLQDAALGFLPIPEMQLVYLPVLTTDQSLQLATALGNSRHLNEIQSAMLKSDPSFREVFSKVFASSNFPNEVEILNDFQEKVMIIHGAEDRMINFDYIKTLKIDKLFQGKIEICPHGSHMSFLDNPDFIIKNIQRFSV